MTWLNIVLLIYTLVGGALIFAAVPGVVRNERAKRGHVYPWMMIVAMIFILIFWLPLLMIPERKIR